MRAAGEIVARARIDAYPVPAAALGLIQRGVGAREHVAVVERLAGPGDRDADRDRHVQAGARRGADRPAQALGDADGGTRIVTRQQDEESSPPTR